LQIFVWGLVLTEQGCRGLHHSEDEKEEVEDGTKAKKSEHAEMRKIYRESERILREKRCMIPPAPAPRLSFANLFQKVEEKVKELMPAPSESVSPSASRSVNSVFLRILLVDESGCMSKI